MSSLYLETSAILAWLFTEDKSDQVIQLMNEYGDIVSSVLSSIEVERALIRAETQQLIKPAERKILKGLYTETSSSWIYLEITTAIRGRTYDPFPVEPIRSLDAIHLATALEFLQIYPDLAVLSFDRRIKENLIPLGLHQPKP